MVNHEHRVYFPVLEVSYDPAVDSCASDRSTEKLRSNLLRIHNTAQWFGAVGPMAQSRFI
jgi:hypothetical protein